VLKSSVVPRIHFSGLIWPAMKRSAQNNFRVADETARTPIRSFQQ
jgi:hypothetical protein